LGASCGVWHSRNFRHNFLQYSESGPGIFLILEKKIKKKQHQRTFKTKDQIQPCGLLALLAVKMLTHQSVSFRLYNIEILIRYVYILNFLTQYIKTGPNIFDNSN